MKEKGKGGEERRKYIRFACKAEFKAIIDFNADVARRATGKFAPIDFRPGEKGEVRDISEKGISIELDHILTEGMIIKMALENPVTDPIQTGARVVWANKLDGEKGRYAMGLAFRYMSEKHQRNLKSLIEFIESIPQ
jgi:c-di-GMP-binding flagellar brake protein YcgR